MIADRSLNGTRKRNQTLILDFVRERGISKDTLEAPPPPSIRYRKNKFRGTRNRGSRDIGKCGEQVIIVCNQGHQFYVCLPKLRESIREQVMRSYCKEFPICENCEAEQVKYGEACPYDSQVGDEVSGIIYGADYGTEYPDFRTPSIVWRRGNQSLAKCSCRPTRKVDENIVEREPLNEMARYKPCEFRCAQFQETGKCVYEINRRKMEKEKQKKLEKYLGTEALDRFKRKRDAVEKEL